MNILFIYPIPSPKHTFIDYHHGLSLLSALAKAEGHQSSLYMTHQFSQQAINRAVQQVKPDLLAYSVTSDQLQLAQAHMDYLSRLSVFSLVGGVHASVRPEDFIDRCDCVCRGEGEVAWTELLRGKSFRQINNLVYSDGGSIHHNPMHPFLQDLDALPFSDRELFDYQSSLDIDHRADFIAGRGCPYRCSYCVNNWLHSLADGRYVRLRSAENLLLEIQQVLNRYQRIDSICFQDDTFTFNKQWIEAFCGLYRRQIHLPFVCNLRAETASREMIAMLADTGCKEIRIGVEQGNERLRRDVLKRKMSNQQLVEAFTEIKKAGIRVFAYNMVGIPGETKSTIQETIDLNKRLKPDKIHVSLFHPYPGTELYDQCLAADIDVARIHGSYFAPVAAIETDKLKKKEIEFLYRTFRVAVLFPFLLPFAKFLARIKVRKHQTLYDISYTSMFRIAQFIQRHMPKRFRTALFNILKV
ncbi:MAG TPA: radical SAM protein [bacterium]|nr:radical SAM protein [bacterium]HPG46652.1 radical SAM protein [bacterium]HPM98815.1 radical SAM protein [bacterium]